MRDVSPIMGPEPDQNQKNMWFTIREGEMAAQMSSWVGIKVWNMGTAWDTYQIHPNPVK